MNSTSFIVYMIGVTAVAIGLIGAGVIAKIWWPWLVAGGFVIMGFGTIFAVNATKSKNKD